MENLKPLGVDVNNNEVVLQTLSIGSTINMLYAYDKNLISLTIPNGITHVHCQWNKLKSLSLPDSVSVIHSDKELFDYDTCKCRKVYINYGD